MKGRSVHPEAERGSILVMLAITVFLFLSASVIYSSSQVRSAQVEQVNFAHNQAMLAAEAGIYTAFDTNQDYMTATPLWPGAPGELSFQATRSAAAPPMTIRSTGSYLFQDTTFVVQATATVGGGQVLTWVFK